MGKEKRLICKSVRSPISHSLFTLLFIFCAPHKGVASPGPRVSRTCPPVTHLSPYVFFGLLGSCLRRVTRTSHAKYAAPKRAIVCACPSRASVSSAPSPRHSFLPAGDRIADLAVRTKAHQGTALRTEKSLMLLKMINSDIFNA